MGKRILPTIISRSKELIWWTETAEGYSLYRDSNGAGGARWWSDEIGGGVIIWDTSLVSEVTLLTALNVEAETRGERSLYQIRGDIILKLQKELETLRKKLEQYEGEFMDK